MSQLNCLIGIQAYMSNLAGCRDDYLAWAQVLLPLCWAANCERSDRNAHTTILYQLLCLLLDLNHTIAHSVAHQSKTGDYDLSLASELYVSSKTHHWSYKLIDEKYECCSC